MRTMPFARMPWVFAVVALVTALAPAAPPAAAAAGATIATVAGGLPRNAPATDVSIHPAGVASDGAGNLYTADPAAGLVWRITPAGRASVIAGDGTPCMVLRANQALPEECRPVRERVPALGAHLTTPNAVAVDEGGNVYVSETRAHVVRRIDAATGTITVVAGDGERRPDYDSSVARRAVDVSVVAPRELALDPVDGGLYVLEAGLVRVRKISPDGTIRTVAGCVSNCDGPAADGAPVFASSLVGLSALAVSADGRLFTATGTAVWEVDRSAGVLRLVAGDPVERSLELGRGEGGPARDARFTRIEAIAFAPDGSLLLIDEEWNRIQRIDAPVTPSSRVRHIAGCYCGTGPEWDEHNGYSGDGGPATAAAFALGNPALTGPREGEGGLAVDRDGNVVVADINNNRVRRIDASAGTIVTAVGNGTGGTFPLVMLPGSFQQPIGGFSGDGRAATEAQFYGPADVAVARDGRLYVLDRHANRVRRIDADGTITTVVGSGCVGGYTCNHDRWEAVRDGAAVRAKLYGATAIALDASGTQLYVADAWHWRLRQVNLGATPVTVYPLSANPITIPPGHVATIAGTGYDCFPPYAALRGNDCGDGRPATSARFGFLSSVAVGASGDVFVADSSTHQVRRIDGRTGVIHPLAGVPWVSRCTGSDEGQPGLATRLCGPVHLEVAPDGSLYVAEVGNPGVSIDSRIRRIDLSDPTATAATVAGTGVPGYAGDGGPARSAQLAYPHGMAFADDGSVLVADTGNSRIRRIAPDGTIGTVAGVGELRGLDPLGCGAGGDDGPAAEALLCAPLDVALARDGTLYVADQLSNRVRAVTGL